MIVRSKIFPSKIDELSAKRKSEILNAADDVKISGTAYYVSNDGDDNNDGLSPSTSWRTVGRVSDANLKSGDAVLFRRGDTFRGTVYTRSNVTYAAFGSGDKPKLFSWDKNLASPELWEEFDAANHIWKLKETTLDVGTLVFNDGEFHSRKHIPTYIGGKFVCRDDESKDFVISRELNEDLDIYWHFDKTLTSRPSPKPGVPYSEMEDSEAEENDEENFPVPDVVDAYGELYLKCDKGNPAEAFSSIEALARRFGFAVGDNEGVRIDNFCIKYIGCHGVAAVGKCVSGLTVTNCEIGWIGGVIHQYFGTDPNYPQGHRGTVGRFGNGIEIYGGCKDYTVKNCYIYQCYDAAITHQRTSGGETVLMHNVSYTDNLVEKCVYSIEYFLEMTCGDRESEMRNVKMSGNILREAGYGWGQQRHNKHTPAHIKGWSFTNRAFDYSIFNNIFDRSAFRMLHLVAEKEEYCPIMRNNVYVQHLGGMLGQYGGNEAAEPPIIMFDERVEDSISNVLKDEGAEIYVLDSSEN